jgi:hypothetical protein
MARASLRMRKQEQPSGDGGKSFMAKGVLHVSQDIIVYLHLSARDIKTPARLSDLHRQRGNVTRIGGRSRARGRFQ